MCLLETSLDTPPSHAAVEQSEDMTWCSSCVVALQDALQLFQSAWLLLVRYIAWPTCTSATPTSTASDHSWPLLHNHHQPPPTHPPHHPPN
jgi:hypothetical protein